MAKRRRPAKPKVKRMDVETFWAIIEWARLQTTDREREAILIDEFLQKLEGDEIARFDDLLWGYMNQLYRWDLWGVASIINGSCSDDGFDYFRGWVIAQGREFFDAVLEDPARVGDRVEPGQDAECDSFLVVARHAYVRKTGQEMPFNRNLKWPEEPLGQQAADEELPRLYPTLWERFVGDHE